MQKETIKARALPAHLDAIKATGKERLVSDSVTANLFLKVSAQGKKSWRWQSAIGGKTVKRNLGRWPMVGLADARTKADELNGEREAGEVIAPATFETVASDFIADKIAAKKGQRSIHEYERQLRTDINPTIGAKMIRDITRKDIDAIIDPMRKAGKMVLSNRTSGLLNQVFKWAMKRDLVSKNPADHITKYDEGAHIDNSYAFTIRQMAELYLAAGDLDRNGRDAVRLLILCGLRRNEAFGARMVDFDGEVWTLPMPERVENKGRKVFPLCHTKNGQPHPMKLAALSKAIFDARKGQTYLFTKGEPHRYMRRDVLDALRDAVAKRGYDFPETWEYREIRRGFRSALVSDEMFDLGYDFSLDDCEIAMNHKQKKLVRTYTKARYAAKIGRMLDAWEELLRLEISKLK